MVQQTRVKVYVNKKTKRRYIKVGNKNIYLNPKNHGLSERELIKYILTHFVAKPRRRRRTKKNTNKKKSKVTPSEPSFSAKYNVEAYAEQAHKSIKEAQESATQAVQAIANRAGVPRRGRYLSST